MITGLSASWLPSITKNTLAKQHLGVPYAAWVNKQLAGRRVARRVLVAQPDIEVTELDPARVAAPLGADRVMRSSLTSLLDEGGFELPVPVS